MDHSHLHPDIQQLISGNIEQKSWLDKRPKKFETYTKYLEVVHYRSEQQKTPLTCKVLLIKGGTSIGKHCKVATSVPQRNTIFGVWQVIPKT